MTAPDHPRFRITPIHALLAWTLVLLVISSLPVKPPPEIRFFFSDKLAHAVFYAPLGAFFLWSFPHGRSRFFVFARAALAAGAYGFLIELIQAVLPWRHFEFADALANLVGASIGAAIALWLPNVRIMMTTKTREPPPS